MHQKHWPPLLKDAPIKSAAISDTGVILRSTSTVMVYFINMDGMVVTLAKFRCEIDVCSPSWTNSNSTPNINRCRLPSHLRHLMIPHTDEHRCGTGPQTHEHILQHFHNAL